MADDLLPCEPAAWRWRARGDRNWTLTADGSWLTEAYEHEPLYAHPQPDAVRGSFGSSAQETPILGQRVGESVDERVHRARCATCGTACGDVTECDCECPLWEPIDSLPGDVVRLVIAAREIAFGDGISSEAIKELDAASEAFAERVPWEDEPAQDAAWNDERASGYAQPTNPLKDRNDA